MTEMLSSRCKTVFPEFFLDNPVPLPPSGRIGFTKEELNFHLPDGRKIVSRGGAGKQPFKGIYTYLASTIGRLRAGESEKLLLHAVPTELWDALTIGG